MIRLLIVFIIPALASLLGGPSIRTTADDTADRVIQGEPSVPALPTGMPDDPLSTFELPPGFQIELIAAEPLVADPIDMEIDEFGRLYVLEFHSYPTNWTGVDRIVLLRDTDDDGRMDARTVFADSLAQAMGIMRWKNGLIVAAPPEVIYLEDTDGDGRADVQRVLLTGFHHGDGESDVNNPTYGLDNGIYLANGPRSESDIYFPSRPDGPRIPVEASNRNIRFRPDKDELTAQSGRTQYGITFDPWGHPLYTNNRNHIYEEVIAAEYLARNPDLLVSDATTSISDHGAATQVFPITEDPEYQILTDVGEITSACGITYYDGGLFPEPFRNVAFVAEPAHNLVHVDRVRWGGATLVAERILPHADFLASTDPRFRPVNTYVGPDGALYVVDYYRTIIEGPAWLADEVLQSGRLYEGTEKGRIYRITPDGTRPADWTRGLSLGDATNEELVSYLDDPNYWWRINAQRLLVDRSAMGVAAQLESLVRTGGPAGRLHALWTLDGLGALTPELVRVGLQDEEPGIRENAIRLAEQFLDGSDRATAADANAAVQNLIESLLAMRSDPDAKVRFQLLLTLGGVESSRAASVRDELLFRDIGDEWVQVAALSSPFVRPGAVLDRVVEQYRPEYATFAQRLAALVAAKAPPDRVRQLTAAALAPTADPTWHAPVLKGIARGIGERRADELSVPPGETSSQADGLSSQADEISSQADGLSSQAGGLSLPIAALESALFDHPAEGVRAAALDLIAAHGHPPETREARAQAIEIARDSEEHVTSRVRAIEFLLLGDAAAHAELWTDLIGPTEAAEVQAVAFRALGEVPGTTVSRLAINAWPVLTSTVRDAALSGVLDYPFDDDRIVMLLDAIEQGTVQPAQIGWSHKVTLMRDIPDDLKARARDLIMAAEEEVRRETAGYLRQVDAMTPDPERGREVFAQQCARCHALGDIAAGASVGPDLMSVRGWEEADLIDQILQPNKAIARGYELWRVTLESGEVVEGMIASEAARALTLRDEFGRETTISRRNISALEGLNAGVMPADFGTRITHQEMADLVAFIRVGR